MAKVTKTSQVDLGKKLGSTHPKIDSMTVEEIRAMEWKPKQDMAAQLALLHPDIPDSPYLDDAHRAFIEAFTEGLTRKLRTYDNALRSYDRARTGISAEQAKQNVAKLLRTINVRGTIVRLQDDGSSLSVRRGDVEVTIYFKVERDGGGWLHTGGDCVRHPDDPNKRAGKCDIWAEMSTSGRTYSMTEASVLATLVTEMTSAANEVIVSIKAGAPIVWTWPTEERKDVVQS